MHYEARFSLSDKILVSWITKDSAAASAVVMGLLSSSSF